jgi:TetR/AcrR family transcriptional repressor of nem operon
MDQRTTANPAGTLAPSDGATASGPATKKGEETRNRILEAATRLIHERGYKNTGLQDILTESGVPRGSFYFYFPSKEALGLELLSTYRTRHRAELEATMFPPHGSAAAQIAAFFDQSVRNQMEGGCKRGCLLGNLAAELTDENENLRRAIAAVFLDLRDLIARTLARGQASGELATDFEPTHAAEFLLSVFEGAILLAKARRDPAALTASAQMLERYMQTLRNDPGPERSAERRAQP